MSNVKHQVLITSIHYILGLKQATDDSNDVTLCCLCCKSGPITATLYLETIGLFFVQRSARIYFLHMQTSQLSVKGYKIWASVPWDTELRRIFFVPHLQSHAKIRLIQSACTTRKGIEDLFLLQDDDTYEFITPNQRKGIENKKCQIIYNRTTQIQSTNKWIDYIPN